MPNFQVAKIFICRRQLADIAHVDTVLVQHAAQRVTGRNYIFVDTRFVLGFIVQFILWNGFIFLSRLVDRLTSLFSSSMVLMIGAELGW